MPSTFEDISDLRFPVVTAVLTVVGVIAIADLQRCERDLGPCVEMSETADIKWKKRYM